ncbi:MAG TPA: MBL fold metallo-hydrolase [Fimbriimonas sp.]|nr:MBL fold metallo-hydrolase [Fimbriimonas sp.]
MIFFPPVQASYAPSPITKIVFLGTGTPNPDPAHQGPSVAIVVNGQPYIVDAGPGMVRQAAAANLKMEDLTKAFITHLHSDHTMGLPDLIFTPAVTGRVRGIDLWGPRGLKPMVKHIQDAWTEDREIRFFGGEPSIKEAYKVEVHEIEPGLVYEDSNVKVRAFLVNHGSWKYAYGYRFETPDRVIVISGDTTYSPNLVENAKGCDVLIHEAYSAKGLAKRTADWQAYHSRYHTSGYDVGKIANGVHPKLLLLYHELPFHQPSGEILEEVKSVFSGDAKEAKDLDQY